MAEEAAGERTEEASERQIEKFRSEGRVASSRELVGGAALGAGALGLVWAAPGLGAGLVGFARAMLARTAAPSLSEADVPALVLGAMTAVAPGVLAVLVPAAAVGLAAGLLANGGNVTTDAITPKLERLDPLGGLQRTFLSAAPWTGILKRIAAAGLVAWAAWAAVEPWVDRIPWAAGWAVSAQAAALADLTERILARAVPAALLLGAADFGWERWRIAKEMRMTRQQVREENKDTEGDPHVRAHRRRRARQIATSRQLRDVAGADVVVTNPTHYAVALRYRKEENAAPVVVARGVDHFALQIRAAATRSDVAIVENRPLARALHAQ
ncbi:MAG: flagellar biosynthesis protein FlhB, partial [Myxococcota bacterium]